MKSKKEEKPAQSSRNPEQSRVKMTELVLPQHTNALGGIFGGVVMSWVDIAAAIAATRHSGRVCVTASIDELHFLKPIKKGYIVNIDAVVTSVHRTSCEVKVDVSAENPIAREHFHTARAFLTFVSLDESGRPTPMAPLKTKTQGEKILERDADKRRNHRKKLKAELEAAN